MNYGVTGLPGEREQACSHAYKMTGGAGGQQHSLPEQRSLPGLLRLRQFPLFSCTGNIVEAEGHVPPTQLESAPLPNAPTTAAKHSLSWAF